jgi:hypothetical protein
MSNAELPSGEAPPPEEEAASAPNAASDEADSDTVEGEAAPADEDDDDDGGDDYGPPFVTRSFGGEFVWAEGDAFTCKILRVRPGENVIVSTQGRKDMIAMLTGGRGVLEVLTADGTDRVELLPGSPIPIRPGHDYRLVALTEVELYTVYSPG